MRSLAFLSLVLILVFCCSGCEFTTTTTKPAANQKWDLLDVFPNGESVETTTYSFSYGSSDKEGASLRRATGPKKERGRRSRPNRISY